MENMKWGKPSIEELPEHSSRARPLTESELSFRKQGGAGNKEPIEGGLEKTPAQRIARHHAEKIKDERRIKDRRNQIQEIALPVTKEDLELEKKFVAAELENFYANFDNDKDPEKVLRKDRLTNRLDQIENRLSAIPDGNNIKEGGIPVADKKDDGGANNVQENINKPNDVAQGASGDKITPAEAPPPFEEKRKRREKIEEQELNDARKSFAVADPAHGGYGAYERKKHEYEIRIDAYKDFIIEHRKLTLETKGLFEKKEDKGKGEYRKLNSEEVQYELEKYIKENVVPHFAVVEAAKIQEARIEPSFIERMKDSKWGSFAGKMIDGYRKMPWQKKLLVSAGLLGVGVTAGDFRACGGGYCYGRQGDTKTS